MDTLKPLVDEKPVVIFSRASSDPVSHTIKQLFGSYGANPTVYELDEMPNGQDVETALQIVHGGSPNLPAVFIGGDLVGGATDVIGLQVRGELVQMLINARAIWFWNRSQ